MRILLFLLCLSCSLEASVWEASEQWNQDWNQKFGQWIAGPDYHQQIFTEGKYAGLKTDCADAVYLARAIFAKENSLPFSFEGNGELIDNKLEDWDHLPVEERFKKFAARLSYYFDTYTLAGKHSVSINPLEVRPGDFYVVEWEYQGSTVRHASMVKEVLETGQLVLFSSTTPYTEKILNRREGMPSRLFDSSPWGFKRFNGQKSDEQSRLRSEWGDKFFIQLARSLQTRSEKTEEILTRKINNACEMLKRRAELVTKTWETRKKRTDLCLSSSEYDLYSTPNRDAAIQKLVNEVRNGAYALWKSGRLEQLSSDWQAILNQLIGRERSSSGKNGLDQLCLIEVTTETGDLGTLNLDQWHRLNTSGKISSNPNHSISARWGGKNDNRFSCQ